MSDTLLTTPAVGTGRRLAGITGLGTALPGRVVASSAIAERLGVDSGWIAARTGIRERRHVEPGETLTELAARSGAAALDDAATDPSAVDLVLVATTTADDITPAAAPLVAGALGCDRAGAMDVGAACTGFVAGLALAAAQVESGRSYTVLLIGADMLSRYTDPDDRRTAALFGDGAGAVVIGAVDGEAGIGPVVLDSEPRRDLLFASRARAVIEMEGQEVFRHAVARMVEATRAVCDPGEIDLFVYHQANARILRAVAARLGIEDERVVSSIGRHGNTSAASIPLALAAARDDGRLTSGARVLLCAFGAGFTWGAGVITW